MDLELVLLQGSQVSSIETQKKFTLEDTLNNLNKLYVFGDNLTRTGTKGQACIRNAPNSFGIATKRAPCMDTSCFFLEDDIKHVLKDLEALKKLVDTGAYSAVVFPEDGLGTGLARLQEHAPTILDMLFKFQNNALQTQSIPDVNPSNNFHQTGKKFYTGIGSRSTPPHILYLMAYIAHAMGKNGYILRSGGADGADLAFEEGAGELKEIYLPWKGFNNSNSHLHSISDAAMHIASTLHPRWQYIPESVKKLMARNCYQILGEGLNTPSEVVICWTPDGCTSSSTRTPKTGGTGQAIDLADKLGVPVYNLQNSSDIIKLLNILL